ncbi:MAG: S41 family peptidase [Xanthomonadales bacterium]|nr:S41 family peptidase [Xanthomonadales bacterium]
MKKITFNAEENFEELWKTFFDRYPFFKLRNVDWKRQYDTFRPKVSRNTSEDELFDILCDMLAPLNDGHVELMASTCGDERKRYFNPEPKPGFWQEFTKKEIKSLFKVTKNTLFSNGFEKPKKSASWILRYCKSSHFGYLRILELEGEKKQKLTTALDQILSDFKGLDGVIIDIRNNPGGDDSTVIQIVNRFCDQKRVAFHRKTKRGHGENEYSKLKTWHINPQGDTQFTGPIVLLTCDSVFSGGEVFALAIKELPYVTVIGDHTNGIFSYQLEKKLAGGWRYCLSYQVYFSADMVCYEGIGVPADIELLNRKSDIEDGVDPLIIRALELLKFKGQSK